MKKPKLTVLLSPHCRHSRELYQWLLDNNIEFCPVWWHEDPYNQHPKYREEAARLTYMVINEVLDGYQEIPPAIDYTDEEIEKLDIPQEHSRWVRTCACHASEPYCGPNLRGFPSFCLELENGELGLWDSLLERDRGEVEDITPAQMYENFLNPEKMVCSVPVGVCIGAQSIEGAMATAACPYFSNNIIKTAVKNYIKKYCTIEIKNTIDISEPELVRIKTNTSREHHV